MGLLQTTFYFSGEPTISHVLMEHERSPITEKNYQLFLAYFNNKPQPVNTVEMKDELLQTVRTYSNGDNVLISDFEKVLQTLDVSS